MPLLTYSAGNLYFVTKDRQRRQLVCLFVIRWRTVGYDSNYPWFPLLLTPGSSHLAIVNCVPKYTRWVMQSSMQMYYFLKERNYCKYPCEYFCIVLDDICPFPFFFFVFSFVKNWLSICVQLFAQSPNLWPWTLLESAGSHTHTVHTHIHIHTHLST